jgi:hypothetical protein
MFSCVWYSRETSRADVLSAVQKAAGGGAAEPLSVDVVGQGQLAASALLRLPSAALAARLKERLGCKLLSSRENVVFFPDRLKHGKKISVIMYSRGRARIRINTKIFFF